MARYNSRKQRKGRGNKKNIYSYNRAGKNNEYDTFDETYILDPGDGNVRIDLQDINSSDYKNYKRGIEDTNYVRRGSRKEKDELYKLMDGYNNTNLDMVDFYQNNKAWLLGHNDSKSKMSTGMRSMNKMYQRRMLSLCLAPLSEGLKSEAVIESVGMFIGFYASSPDARKFVKGSICKKLSDTIDKNAKKNGLMGGFYSSNFMQKKKDRYQRILHEGRLPLTEESAALTDIAIKKEYYEKLRSGDYTSKEQLKDDYDKANEVLDSLIVEDGLDSNDVRQKRNVMMGRLMDKSDTFKHMFTGLSDGSIKKADSHKEELLAYDSHGRPFIDTVNVWSGEFFYEYTDEDGNTYEKVSNDIDFTPREPITEAEYTEGFAKISRQYFDDFSRSDDMDFEDMSDEYLSVINSVIYQNYDIAETFDVDYDKPLSRQGIKLRKELNDYMKLYKEEDGITADESLRASVMSVSANFVDLSDKSMYSRFEENTPAYDKYCMKLALDTYDIDFSTNPDSDIKTRSRFSKEDEGLGVNDPYIRYKAFEKIEEENFKNLMSKTYGYENLDELEDALEKEFKRNEEIEKMEKEGTLQKGVEKSYEVSDMYGKVTEDALELKDVTNNYRKFIISSLSYSKDKDETLRLFKKWGNDMPDMNANKLHLDQDKVDKAYSRVGESINEFNSESNKYKPYYNEIARYRKDIDTMYSMSEEHMDYKQNPVEAKDRVKYEKRAEPDSKFVKFKKQMKQRADEILNNNYKGDNEYEV